MAIDPFDQASIEPKKEFKGILAGKVGYLLSGVFLLTALIAGAYLDQKGQEQVPQDSAQGHYLVSVKVIDDSGHPMAGVNVYLGKKRFGKTDAFGEWRRYVKLKAGHRLAVQVRKNKEGQALNAELILPIQPDQHGEPILHARFNLKQPKLPPPKQPTYSPAAKRQMGEVSLQGLPSIKTFRLDSQLGPTNYKEKAETTLRYLTQQLLDAGLKHQQKLPDVVIKLKIQTSKTSRHKRTKAKKQSIFMFTELDFRHEQTAFFTHLKQRPKEDATKLANMILIHTPQTHRVYQEGSDWYLAYDPSDYRKPHHTDLLQTPAGELVALRMVGHRHQLLTDSESPCKNNRSCQLRMLTPADIPPLKGWTRRYLEVKGALPMEAQIFVSGFKARQLQPGKYRYWGKIGNRTNVTVTHAGGILHREQVLIRKNQPTKIAIPAVELAFARKPKNQIELPSLTFLLP